METNTPPLSLSSHRALFAVAGALSWIILHRRPAPGDQALGGICASFFVVLGYLYHRDDPQAVYHAVQLLVIYLGSLAVTTSLYRISWFHPLASFPGPFLWRVSALVLTRVSYTGHRHLYLESLHKQYGKLVRIGPDLLSVCDGSQLQAIYGASGDMIKPDFYKLPGHPHAKAIFFKQPKEVHATRKYIWAQAFTAAALENFFDPLEREIWNLMRCISDRTGKDGTLNLSECLNQWAYDVMSRVTFGGSNGLRLMRDGDPDKLIYGGKIATVHGDCIGQSPWLMDILWRLWGDSSSVRMLKKLAATMVHTRLAAPKVEVRDLMSYLIEGDPRTGEKIEVSDLEIDAVLAIQGGSDNTSTTLILCSYFLLSRRALYRQLRDELEKVVPDPSAALDRTQLAQIPLLDAVIKESLRFGSPYYLPRLVPRGGATISGVFVPEGTIISSASYAVQMSEENFYPRPEEYLPERWLPQGLGPDTVTNKDVLASFTFGPHVCVGKQFAMHEMRLCLARMVLIYDMQLPGGPDGGEFYKGLRNMRTTIFDNPLRVKAVPRPGVHIPEFS